jgi:hypothetical protein
MGKPDAAPNGSVRQPDQFTLAATRSPTVTIGSARTRDEYGRPTMTMPKCIRLPLQREGLIPAISDNSAQFLICRCSSRAVKYFKIA